jgi:thiol:disulfide interchange protein DsbD
LAGAFAWATQQPPGIAIVAFVAAGLGMASPYMLLGANPNWLSFLPKPGPWMVTFERVMGFLLLGMVIWLLHPLITQIGVEGLEWTLGFLVAIGLACWLLGKIDVTMDAAVRWKYRAGATAIALGAGVVIYGWIYPLSEATGSAASSEIPWRLWSKEDVEQTVRSGKTVFVDFTAAYCTNCKVNKAVAINQPEFLAKLKDLDAVPFQADFSLGDPEIFAALQEHGRSGLPLNVIYPAGKPDEPIVLKVLFSKEYLLQKLDEAGPSRTASADSFSG